MSAAAFAKSFVVRQGAVSLATFGALALFAPLVLQLGPEPAVAVLVRVAISASIATLALLLAAWALVRELRYVLRALAIGSVTLEASDVDLLRRAPSRALVRHLGAGVLTAILLAALPPVELGAELARELGLLTLATFASAAIPALVLHQASVSSLLEQAPLEPVLACLEGLEGRDLPRRHSQLALVLAITLPVSLVGVGGVLACHAHLRASLEQRRIQTAYAIGRGVLGPSERPVAAARRAAADAAISRGYGVSFRPGAEDAPPRRGGDDRVRLTVALEDSAATIDFDASLPREASVPFALAGAVMAAIASALGAVLSRLVARDVSSAVARLRGLGTETVLRGELGDAGDARLREIAALGHAVSKLSDRFRVFAQAQERALEARENARRARGLLFASVSHDLRSPLNAILGFAESIDTSPLTHPQRESLQLISSRGRELVALIETILDAARVEAGQLRLQRQPTASAELVELALARAAEIAGVDRAPRLEIVGSPPRVDVDPVQVSKALAVVIAHAVRTLSAEDSQRGVLVRATTSDEAGDLRVDVTPAAGGLDAVELAALFERRETGRARGLVLGLSLARAVVELHGGKIVVEARGDGLPAVAVHLPLVR